MPVIGNHDTLRVKGMVNLPLGGSLAVRLAGVSLQRDGYTDNITTGNDIDNRDQWALRGSLQWLVTDQTTINLMTSYMKESSSRTRSAKQLCHNDPSALLGCLPDRLELMQKVIQRAQAEAPEGAVVAVTSHQHDVDGVQGCAIRPAQVVT